MPRRSLPGIPRPTGRFSDGSFGLCGEFATGGRGIVAAVTASPDFSASFGGLLVQVSELKQDPSPTGKEPPLVVEPSGAGAG